MYHPRHLKARHHVLIAVLAALLAVVAVAGAGALRSQHGSGSPYAGPRGGVHRTTAAAAEPAASTRGCARAGSAEDRALRAAARSLAQWQVHVAAMNKLVAGRITLAQATAFWARTRIGAQQRVDEFRGADRGVAALARRCVSDARRQPSAGAPGAAVRCSASVDARERTLVAARIAVRTWQQHIKDMEALRMGMMSPAQALRMWHLNWHKGVAQLARYHDALRQSVRQPACPGS